jgi:hypothetical protein
VWDGQCRQIERREQPQQSRKLVNCPILHAIRYAPLSRMVEDHHAPHLPDDWWRDAGHVAHECLRRFVVECYSGDPNVMSFSVDLAADAKYGQ